MLLPGPHIAKERLELLLKEADKACHAAQQLRDDILRALEERRRNDQPVDTKPPSERKRP